MTAPAQSSQCSSVADDKQLEAFDANIVPGTRHYELLNSNEVPLESESLFVRAFLPKARHRLSQLEGQISELRPVPKHLEEEHASLLTHISRNAAIVSPREATARGRFDVSASPWILGHISSHWRHVALETPALWALVAVNYRNVTGDPESAYPTAMLETQIRRATTLKVHFWSPNHGWYSASGARVSEHQIGLFKLLVAQTSRWEQFYFEPSPELLPLLDAQRERLPFLRRLWIDLDRVQVTSIHSFSIAPSLRDFSLLTSGFVSVPISVHLLTRYDLVAPWETHLHVLRTAKDLVEARIVVFDVDTPRRTASGDPIEVVHLCRLFVSHSDVLDSLKTPALTDLGFQQDDDPAFEAHIDSLVLRSGCELRHFCIRGVPDADKVTKILNTYSSILNLTVICRLSSAPDALMTALTVANGAEVVAPQLRRIFLAALGIYMGSDRYIEMVQSRWRLEGRALACAGLLFDFPYTPTEVLRQLDVLAKDGLETVVLNHEDTKDRIRDLTWIAQWPFHSC